jgi:hypothetical protein
MTPSSSGRGSSPAQKSAAADDIEIGLAGDDGRAARADDCLSLRASRTATEGDLKWRRGDDAEAGG